MPVDPTSPRGKQAKLFAEKQEEEWRRAQERQAAMKEDPADDSDQSDDIATFITVGTETFVTTVDQQFLENDDIDPRDWDPPPSERIDGNPSTVHGAEEYPAVEGYAAKTRKKKKGPKAVGKKLGIKITDDQISTSIATWQAAVEEDGIDDADLFLGKLKMQNPDRVLGVIADRVSSAALQGPQQVFLNDNSLGQIPESVWTLSGFQSIRELFLHNNQIDKLPKKLVQSLPHLKLLNLENNELQILSAQLIESMLARPKFELRIHRNNTLVSPPLAVSGCVNPMDIAKLKRMRKWWKDHGSSEPSEMSEPLKLIPEPR